MSIPSEAWFLYAGSASGDSGPGRLVRERFELPDLTDEEVLAEPLVGSWEGNMGHSLMRTPIDICRVRNEKRVIIGNAGVVRVLDVGRAVKTVAPGQRALIFAASVVDRYGYPEKILGYDAPGTMGCMATKMKLRQHELIPLPERTKHSLAQWAAFSGRYITAWSNWELAYGTLRLLVPQDQMPEPHVWGWGGGTSLAELELAQRVGCKAMMISGNDRRLAEIVRSGITPLDRRRFGSLSFDERRFSSDAAYRRSYMQAESAFLSEVKQRTEGSGVQIFIDHIGAAVFRVTQRALAREGIVATAGWKEGQSISLLRAVECIGRHQYVHTHYARREQGIAAVTFAEETGWMPHLDDRIYTFDEIPELAERYLAGDHGFFPLFSVHASA